MKYRYYLFGGEYGASIVYDPTTINQEQIDYAVKLNELPTKPERKEGFIIQIFCDNETQEVWYEYKEIKPME